MPPANSCELCKSIPPADTATTPQDCAFPGRRMHKPVVGEDRRLPAVLGRVRGRRTAGLWPASTRNASGNPSRSRPACVGNSGPPQRCPAGRQTPRQSSPGTPPRSRRSRTTSTSCTGGPVRERSSRCGPGSRRPGSPGKQAIPAALSLLLAHSRSPLACCQVLAAFLVSFLLGSRINLREVFWGSAPGSAQARSLPGTPDACRRRFGSAPLTARIEAEVDRNPFQRAVAEVGHFFGGNNSNSPIDGVDRSVAQNAQQWTIVTRSVSEETRLFLANASGYGARHFQSRPSR